MRGRGKDGMKKLIFLGVFTLLLSIYMLCYECSTKLDYLLYLSGKKASPLRVLIPRRCVATYEGRDVYALVNLLIDACIEDHQGGRLGAYS